MLDESLFNRTASASSVIDSIEDNSKDKIIPLIFYLV